jgi:methylphosphotriester-DNA--protein-cysteine methyltransferase
MEYYGRIPSPPLDQFVDRIWYCSDTPSHARERVLPGGGTLGLAINLVETELQIYDPHNPALVRAHAGALVSGISTQSYFYDPRQRASVIGVHFRPGGAFPFLGVSPSEIVDTHVPLDDLWGSVSQNLREQLLEAASPSQRLRIVEAALLRRLRSAPPGHPAVRAALVALRDGGGGARVADVAAEVGLSRRRFIEVFEREVGLTPKLYARLQRFHHVKQRIATRGGPASWAAFAAEHGYFDQSHLLRDFGEFAGMSPAEYLRGRSDETSFDHLVHAYPTQVGAARAE